MEYIIAIGFFIACTISVLHTFRVQRDRDRWRRKAERNRKMAEWLAGEAVRALKQFERIGGVIDDGPVTKELILKAADEAVEEDDDGLS